MITDQNPSTKPNLLMPFPSQAFAQDNGMLRGNQDLGFIDRSSGITSNLFRRETVRSFEIEIFSLQRYGNERVPASECGVQNTACI